MSVYRAGDPLWEDPDQYRMIYEKGAAGEAEET